MGNKKSKPMNQKIVSQKLSNIINKFGVITTDTKATQDCQTQMRSGQIYDPNTNQNIDISCKAEARTQAIQFIRGLTIFLVILLTTLYVVYIIDQGKQNKIDTGKIVAGITMVSLMLLIQIGHIIVTGGLDNLHADPIVYYWWETRQENKVKPTNTNVREILDKFNLQTCKSFDKAKCETERFNKLISLERLDTIEKFNDFVNENPLLKKFTDNWKPIEVKENTINNRPINVFTFKEKNVTDKPKIIETPFLVIGTECNWDPKKKCYEFTKSIETNKNIGSLDTNVLGFYNEGDSPNIIENSIKTNLDNYNTLSKTPCRLRQNKNSCESTQIEHNGKQIQECNWDPNDNKCNKKWKSGEGYEIWTCDLCDDISNKCTVSWRTWTTYIQTMLSSIVLLAFGLSNQFIFKENDESNFTNSIRSTIVMISYIMAYYMAFTSIVFHTLLKMCPDGSDMGIIGRSDLQWYYNSIAIATNPFKVGELFNFWRKEAIGYIIILTSISILTLILLSIEFNFLKLSSVAIGTSLTTGFIYSIVLSLGKPNSNMFFMALFIGWGIGLLFGSLWSLYTDKHSLNNPGPYLSIGALAGSIIGLIFGFATKGSLNPFSILLFTVLGILVGLTTGTLVEREDNNS